MKKILSVFIISLLVVFIASCGKSSSAGSEEPQPQEGDIIYESQKSSEKLSESIGRARELLDSSPNSNKNNTVNEDNDSTPEGDVYVEDTYIEADIEESNIPTGNDYTPETVTSATSEPANSVDTETNSQSESNDFDQGASSGQNHVNNFDLYNNPEQQNTSDQWVLNTSKKKIHYPDCEHVPSIKPENYATTNSSIEDLENEEYVPCKVCFDR